MHPNKMLTIIEALSDDGQKRKQQVIEVYLRCKNDDIARRDNAVKGVFDTSSTVLEIDFAGHERLQLREELFYINFEIL